MPVFTSSECPPVSQHVCEKLRRTSLVSRLHFTEPVVSFHTDVNKLLHCHRHVLCVSAAILLGTRHVEPVAVQPSDWL